MSSCSSNLIAGTVNEKFQNVGSTGNGGRVASYSAGILRAVGGVPPPSLVGSIVANSGEETSSRLFLCRPEIKREVIRTENRVILNGQMLRYSSSWLAPLHPRVSSSRSA